MTGWLTNDPEAARELRRIDREYQRAVEAAKGLKLADKVAAIRQAKAAKLAAYRAI